MAEEKDPNAQGEQIEGTLGELPGDAHPGEKVSGFVGETADAGDEPEGGVIEGGKTK